MESVADRLIRTAACARKFLHNDSRSETVRFILSRQNPDGGFRGKSSESDLYYTVFAAAGLRALGKPIPALRLWRYIRSFGSGEDLDLVHLSCLIRLRTVFPMFSKTRRRYSQALESRKTESAYHLFLKILAGDSLGIAQLPVAAHPAILTEPTPSLAAAVLVNRTEDHAVAEVLLNRSCRSGGFAATDHLHAADLLSTATALFALRVLNADLNEVRRPCLDYIESLWRDSGGFAGHLTDEFEDVEYTFYALLGIGCLME